jgi:branched-subunit amino acid ABC-type transport system permease component
MTEPVSSDRSSSTQDERYARLKAEALAPYRGLRKFIYFAFGASGMIGAFIFFTQLLAGENANEVLPNLALQIGVVALMVWLFRIDRDKK